MGDNRAVPSLRRVAPFALLAWVLLALTLPDVASRKADGDGPAPAAARALRTAAPGTQSTRPSTPLGAPAIGVDDGAGWGAAAAKEILQAHIVWDRVELGGILDTRTQSLRYGFKVLGIVGNVDDATPLSAIDPKRWGAEVVSELQASPGISIAEAANEAYTKGGVANPVQYGRMYLAAVEAMRRTDIRVPLLFDMTGDYPLAGWVAHPGLWSQDRSGGGWLRTAVSTVPGLGRAILANGLAVHPYGAPAENFHDDYGMEAVAAEEATALAVLGSVPSFYVTEIGYDLSSCGRLRGACSEPEQATLLRSAYDVLLSDPHVAGIWWYQSHDDSTGRFGLMDDNGVPRQAFRTLSAIAAGVGQ